MLRISSVKAFVISNIIHNVLLMMTPVALAYAIIALRPPMIFQAPAGAGWITFYSLTILTAGLALIPSSLIAGYVAGRMAEYRPVLHGALSSGVLVVQDMYSVLHSLFVGSPSRSLGLMSLTILSAIAAPLFGALGGHYAAQRSRDATRTNVTPEPRHGVMERGLVPKLLLSLALTACVCTFILFSPTIFCHGGGAGGNCGEGYMASIPAALLALPIVLAGTLYLA